MLIKLSIIFCLFLNGKLEEVIELKIQDIQKTIDISSQLVKISYIIKLENSGKYSSKFFYFCGEPNVTDHLSFIKFEDWHKYLLNYEETKSIRDNTQTWRVNFHKEIQPRTHIEVTVNLFYTQLLSPYPKKISQSEHQLVQYKGNLFIFSPYIVKNQNTKVILSSSHIESYSKVKPVVVENKIIKYGPYLNIAPYSETELLIHYENNSPFLTVTNLERIIEISHWGNVAVEERFDILHTGALLQGSFSRYEFQRENAGASSIKTFKTYLPASAENIYYRDEIGNISTSHMRYLDDAVELLLRPRFPLFGGWKTHYVLGYRLPSYEVLFKLGNSYCLKMPFLDHIYDNMHVAKMTVHVILPEGSQKFSWKIPYNVQILPQTVHYTYLDTIGRPRLSAFKTNLIDQHIQPFQLYYQFPNLYLLQEPSLLIVFFYLLFLIVIIYFRFDFSIHTDESKEKQERILGFHKEVLCIASKCEQLRNQFEDSISKFKSSKDINSFQNNIKRINNEWKNEIQGLQELVNKLKPISPDSIEKLNDILKIDKTIREILEQQVLLVERLVTGKITKQQYLEADALQLKKRFEAQNKYEALLLKL